MDPEMKRSLLEMLEQINAQCDEKSASDERFMRLHKFVSEYSEFVKRPEANEHMLKGLLLSNEIDAFEREGLLEAQTATVLRRVLDLVDPPNLNAGRELYRMAYPPWWKRLFR